LGRNRLRIERTHLPVILALTGVVMLAAVLFVDINGWATRASESFDLSDAGSNRLRIWRESLPMIHDFWLTGTGAGTFSDAMTKYQQSRIWVGSMNRWAHFNNAHSAYLQVVAEGGVLLALPALAALVSAFRIGRRAVREDRGEMLWARIGAAGGLVGIAVQNIWETPLIMPANAILFGTLAGLLLYQRGNGRPERANGRSPLVTATR
jgi:O-antigen ligase